MRSIWLALLAVAGACYSPTVQLGAPCNPATDTCPFQQTCQLAGGQFVCTNMIVDALTLDATHSDSPRMSDGAIADIAAAQAEANTGSGAANSLVFPDPVQPDDTIIVCFTFPTGTSTLASISDSLDNSYSVVVGPVATNGYAHYIAIASSSAGGSDTVTVTLSAAVASGWDVLGLEYTGLALTDAFDASAYDSGNGTTMSSGNVSTLSAHELLLAYGHSSGPMAGPGYTLRDSEDDNLVEDQVVFTTGKYTATATTTSGIWTLILATFVGR
jgi:hypothetical protein